MKLFNWAEAYQPSLAGDDITDKIQKMERTYYIWFLIACFLGLAGVAIILMAPANNLKWHCLGLFLAMEGAISIAVIKLWAHIWLATYRMMWDNKNRIDAELRKSQAMDI